MLRFAEEIMLLLLDEERGETIPLALPQQTFNMVLAGAVLIDLALDDRIDTDLERLVLVDSTPLDDKILDPTLADIASESDVHNIGYWVERTARRATEIYDAAIASLMERGIIEDDVPGVLLLSRQVARSRRYPSIDGKSMDDVRLRVMRILFEDDIPDPRDIAIICLADACGILRTMLSHSERARTRERVELLRRADLIGREVTAAIREHEPTEAPSVAARPLGEIPLAKGLPVIGNAVPMAGDLAAFLTTQYLSLGPVFRVRAFRRQFVVLAGLQANIFATVKGRANFRSYETWVNFNAEFGSMRSLISMDGADHLRLRKIQARGYSHRQLERQMGEAIDVVREEIDGWPTDRPIGGHWAFQRIVAEQISRLIAGVSSRDYLDDLTMYFPTLLKARLTQHLPGLMMKHPRVQRARRRLNELYRKVLADHEPENRDGREPDMIDDLLELHRTDPVFMPEIDLVLSVLGPFFAGIDTAANICAFMLYETLKRPDLLERMTAEADALFDAPGEPTGKHLRSLDITRRVAMETLRLHPVAPALPRTVTNSFDFEGYAIPPGTSVILGTTVPHRLPDCFPDPERFDIERYTTERAEHRVPGAYAPFGLGTHRCLGNGFAESQIVLTMATMLREVVPTLDPPDYRLRVTQAPTPHPAASFRFRHVRRRNDPAAPVSVQEPDKAEI